ncbi:predicted protein [Naegleria gruberi]|uniref:Predicted protein n=1 Tax=Naegleria gruberi TaxID=5762 RepID=D2VIY6_NAEGR|nr:uncharacterized protein NAEGRDRAFT_82645 [Naegleria gruberi]EFC43184.1 predicted protein [Naegleria gruberi]|eukprot:XP_002675928.1 predicted protein [Naegleria gruberi strain NEG-M]
MMASLVVVLLYLSHQTRASEGAKCVGCTIVFRSIESYVNYKEQPIEKSLSEWCSILPDKLSSFCKVFVAVEAQTLIKMFEEKQTPDIICRELGPCKEYPQCTLFKPGQTKYSSKRTTTRFSGKIDWIKEFFDIIAGPIVKSLSDHTPLVDIDGDTYSTEFAFRGSAWRGKDCNDNNAAIYPGRKTSSLSPLYDHNCNGVFGYDKSGKSYEDMFCNSTQTKGVVVFGDSLSAHFRIPPQLFEPKYMTADTYKQLWEIITNEADWPMLSWGTGFLNDTFSDLTPGLSSSIYKHMRNHNRCMHRDYATIAVNGARTGAMKDISLTYKRDQKNDQPVLAFYALVGNDVCAPSHSLDFTTPEEFEANVLVTLNYLEQTLPAGSSVVFVGMAQGGFLFEFLKDQMHPLGVSYPQMYDYLNCLESNPCYGWMNTNGTIRNITSAQAALLSTVYDKIIQKYSFKNFKMYYHEFPLKEVVQMWVKQGGQPKDLIEPFDGFHLSQPGQSLMADYLWGWIKSEHSEIIGTPNPNNAQIINIFGEQGGY